MVRGLYRYSRVKSPPAVASRYSAIRARSPCTLGAGLRARALGWAYSVPYDRSAGNATRVRTSQGLGGPRSSRRADRRNATRHPRVAREGLRSRRAPGRRQVRRSLCQGSEALPSSCWWRTIAARTAIDPTGWETAPILRALAGAPERPERPKNRSTGVMEPRRPPWHRGAE